jgi:hypothetical protein
MKRILVLTTGIACVALAFIGMIFSLGAEAGFYLTFGISTTLLFFGAALVVLAYKMFDYEE